jgi:hypothetical protein
LWLDSVPLDHTQVYELRITRHNTYELEDYSINTETLKIFRANTSQRMSLSSLQPIQLLGSKRSYG